MSAARGTLCQAQPADHLESFPQELVREAWKQYLREGTDTFDREWDRLGLITSPLLEAILKNRQARSKAGGLGAGMSATGFP